MTSQCSVRSTGGNYDAWLECFCAAIELGWMDLGARQAHIRVTLFDDDEGAQRFAEAGFHVERPSRRRVWLATLSRGPLVAVAHATHQDEASMLARRSVLIGLPDLIKVEVYLGTELAVVVGGRCQGNYVYLRLFQALDAFDVVSRDHRRARDLCDCVVRELGATMRARGVELSWTGG